MRAALLWLAVVPLLAQTPDCAAIPGSRQEGELRRFDVETLFEYMNGNAEGYFLYGFQTMQGVTCAKGDVKLIFDVSTFKDFESAYGMFTGNVDTREPLVAVGAGGQVTPRKAVFVKDRYYVEIAAEPEGEHAPLLGAAIESFAKTFEGRVDKPAQIAWFPKEKLQPGSPRLIPQSVLGLRMLSRGYLAQYEHGRAFVVTQASASDAAALFEKLKARFPPSGEAKAGDEAYLAEDRFLGQVVLFRKGAHVGGWANVKDADRGALAASLAAKLP